MEWQEKRKKEIAKILEHISEKFSVPTEELSSKTRKKEFVTARKIIMNILFELFEKDNITHGTIAAVVKRDRTSFLHHRKEHLNEYGRYKNYKVNYDNLKRECQSKITDSI